jgi:hypothetical protein
LWHPSGGEAVVVEAHQGDDFADIGLLANSAGGELRLAGKHRMVFDVALSPEEMEAIAGLDMGQSSFFEHRDPQMVKFLSEAKRPT